MLPLIIRSLSEKKNKKIEKLVYYYDDNFTDNGEPCREFLYEECNKKK